MGYDQTWFVDPLDPDLKCPHCRKVTQDPYRGKCGHILCFDCVQELMLRKIPCPALGCLTPLDLTSVAYDRAAFGTIQKLRVKCASLECKWLGYLEGREEHLAKDCEYQITPCSWGCDAKLHRKYLLAHRNVCPKCIMPCPYCSQVATADEYPRHYEVCPKYVVSCPKGCGASLKRFEVPDHLQRHCGRAEVQCPVVNCTEYVTRDSFSAHMTQRAVHHVELLNAALTVDRTLVQQLLGRVQSLEAQVAFFSASYVPNISIATPNSGQETTCEEKRDMPSLGNI